MLIQEARLQDGFQCKLLINDIDLVELQRKYRPKPAKSIKSSWQELQVSNKVKLRTLEEGVQVNLFPKQNLTHKAPCPKCAEDNYIYWFDYSDEKQKKLGCVKCETRIDVHQAYEVN